MGCGKWIGVKSKWKLKEISFNVQCRPTILLQIQKKSMIIIHFLFTFFIRQIEELTHENLGVSSSLGPVESCQYILCLLAMPNLRSLDLAHVELDGTYLSGFSTLSASLVVRLQWRKSVLRSGGMIAIWR